MQRKSLQTEILSGMVLLMIAATGLLSVILVTYLLYQQGRQTEHLLSLLESQLQLEAKIPNLRSMASAGGVEWWDVRWDREVPERVPVNGSLDAEGLELGFAAQKMGTPLVRRGMPWEPIWYATPIPEYQRTAVARIAPPVSLPWGWTPMVVILSVLIGDVAIFTVFGSYLIRRRIILPLQAFSQASREMAQGSLDVRLPVADIEEVGEAQDAFNHMAEALQHKTKDLEKVNAELLDANRSLYEAKRGIERAERLALVGRLSAGVAHEIGNPMGAMLALLDLVARDAALSENSKEKLQRAMQQGGRVRSILQHLLKFSAASSQNCRPFSLQEIVEECIQLVSPQRAYSQVEFSVEAEQSLLLAMGDPAESTQIILNLLLNAADAVCGVAANADDGCFVPRIRVLLRNALWEDLPQIAPKRAIECLVLDNGQGIAAEDRERIFDPFYSTKPPGAGTGLGLAVALQLVEGQQGKLECRDVEMKGACLVFGLPAAAS